MAHKGKHYPLAWRRDLNLNSSTNRFGLAQFYKFSKCDSTGTIGNFMSVRFVTRIKDQGPIVPWNQWQSEWQDIGPYLIRVTLKLDQIVSSTYRKFSLEIEDYVSGLLFRSSSQGSPTFDALLNFFTFVDYLPQPELFRPEGPLSTIQVRPMTWQELNLPEVP